MVGTLEFSWPSQGLSVGNTSQNKRRLPFWHPCGFRGLNIPVTCSAIFVNYYPCCIYLYLSSFHPIQNVETFRKAPLFFRQSIMIAPAPLGVPWLQEKKPSYWALTKGKKKTPGLVFCWGSFCQTLKINNKSSNNNNNNNNEAKTWRFKVFRYTEYVPRKLKSNTVLQAVNSPRQRRGFSIVKSRIIGGSSQPIFSWRATFLNNVQRYNPARSIEYGIDLFQKEALDPKIESMYFFFCRMGIFVVESSIRMGLNHDPLVEMCIYKHVYNIHILGGGCKHFWFFFTWQRWSTSPPATPRHRTSDTMPRNDVDGKASRLDRIYTRESPSGGRTRLVWVFGGRSTKQRDTDTYICVHIISTGILYYPYIYI